MGNAAPKEVNYGFKIGLRMPILIVFAALFSIYCIKTKTQDHNFTFTFAYLAVLWLIMIWAIVPLIRFKLSGKPAFTANEDYIYDHYGNKKYLWDDIEEIGIEGSKMSVYYYEPYKFYKKPPGKLELFLRRERILLPETPSSLIDMEYIDIPKDDRRKFLDDLDALSVNTA